MSSPLSDNPVPTAPSTRATILVDHPDPKTFCLEDIQGDIYPTFPKDFEWFFFFTIKDATAFKTNLAEFIPLIATASSTREKLQEIAVAKLNRKPEDPKPRIPLRLYQMALTAKAFKPLDLGLTSKLADQHWANGQLAHAKKLGDRPKHTDTEYTPDWEPVWLKNELHGVILVATHCEAECKLAEDEIRKTFPSSIDIVNIVKGRVRDERHNEHFGSVVISFYMYLDIYLIRCYPRFKDGISQPAIEGLVKARDDRMKCKPGVILIGHDGEPNPMKRPAWAKNSAMMAFRKLQQFVPEFNTFLENNPTELEGLTKEQAIELTGAKLIGRFKSGCPIDLSDRIDDPVLGADPCRNNDFDYQKPPPGQERCPYVAHTRKMAPRFTTVPELQAVLPESLIMRAAIPYGEELDEVEKGAKQTLKDRGLAFVSYQSFLEAGFVRQQVVWANNPEFPPIEREEKRPASGFDPIIGNSSKGEEGPREVTGINPKALSKVMSLPDFVVARGGEYFWVPSMTALGLISKGQLKDEKPISANQRA
ncbi:hypothetical protein FRB94_001846 [Tulasnella sp. JGI-2019a]|nr:hypothetical protein FRB94_001846 [Tulasnella sp. JGI-2019a]KAG9030298.1 hypothetical protein FRB95_004130 [Tulasnella sp. JGI-2019a]